MIIIGISNCNTCKELVARHKDYRYIELPSKTMHTTGDILKAKILIGRMKLDIFPIVASDSLEEVISIEEIDPEFKKNHEKLY